MDSDFCYAEGAIEGFGFLAKQVVAKPITQQADGIFGGFGFFWDAESGSAESRVGGKEVHVPFEKMKWGGCYFVFNDGAELLDLPMGKTRKPISRSWA